MKLSVDDLGNIEQQQRQHAEKHIVILMMDKLGNGTDGDKKL